MGGVNWIDLAQDRDTLGCCEQGVQLAGPIKLREFLYWLRNSASWSYVYLGVYNLSLWLVGHNIMISFNGSNYINYINCNYVNVACLLTDKVADPGNLNHYFNSWFMYFSMYLQ